MYNNIQILIQGFYWNQNVINENFKDVSFFNFRDSLGNPQYTQWTNQLDVTPYIIKDSLSPLTYEFENTEKNVDSARLYFTCSDISFEVSDLPNLISATRAGYNVTRMRDFLTLTDETSYVKYLVTVKYKSLNTFETIYQGVISDDIQETFSTSSDSNIIKIQVFGFEKDIKEYYSNKKLSDYSYNLFKETAKYGYLNLDGSYTNPQYIRLDNLLNIWFKTNPATGFRMFVDITDIGKDVTKNGVTNTVYWYVFFQRHLAKNSTIRTQFFKCGFQDALDNNETVWSFLTKLCNAMGWIFYVKHITTGGISEARLVIKNRYSINKTLPIQITSTNKLTPQEISKTSNRIKFWSVYVPNGTMDLGSAGSFWDYFKYIHGYFVSNMNDHKLSNIFFKSLNGANSINYTDYLHTISFEDEKNLTVRYLDLITGFPAGLSNVNYQKNDILILDGGDCETYWRVDLSTLKNYEGLSTVPLGANDIQWTGNYGGMMCFQWGSTGVHQGESNLYMYDEYTQGLIMDWFEKNLKILLQGVSNQTTDVSIYGVETNPLKAVQMINDEYFPNNPYFVINEMRIDLINDITNFKLTKEL